MEVNDRMRIIGDIISKLEFSVQSFYKLKRDGDVPKNYLTPELNDLPNLKSQYMSLYNKYRAGAIKNRAAGKELDKIEDTLRNIIAAFHYTLTANRFFDITGKKLGPKLPKRYKNGHNILKKIEGESRAIANYSSALLKNKKELSADALTKKYMIHLWGYFNQIKAMKMYLFKQIEAELKTDIDFVRTHGLTKSMLKHEKHIVAYGTKKNMKQVVMYKSFDKLINILTSLYNERKNSLIPKESLIQKVIGSLQDLDNIVRLLNMPESRIRAVAPQLIKYRNYNTKYIRTLWSITTPKIKQINKEISAEKKAIFRKDLEEIKKMRANIEFLADIAKRHNFMNQLKVLREANSINLKPSNYDPKSSQRFRQLYERAVISITNSMNTKVMSYRSELKTEIERVKNYSLPDDLRQSMIEDLKKPLMGINKGLQRTKATKNIIESLAILDKLLEKADKFMVAWEERTKEILEQEALKSKVKGQVERWLNNIGVSEKVDVATIRLLYPVWRYYLEMEKDNTIEDFLDDLDKHIENAEINYKLYGGLGETLETEASDEDAMRAQELKMTILALRAERSEVLELKERYARLIDTLCSKAKIAANDMAVGKDATHFVKNFMQEIKLERQSISEDLEKIEGRVNSTVDMSDVTDFVTDMGVKTWTVISRSEIELNIHIQNRTKAPIENISVEVLVPGDHGTVTKPANAVIDIGSLSEEGSITASCQITPITHSVLPIDMMIEYTFENGTKKRGKLPPLLLKVSKLFTEPYSMSVSDAVVRASKGEGHYVGFFITNSELADMYDLISSRMKNFQMIITEEHPTEGDDDAVIFWMAARKIHEDGDYLIVVVARKNTITPTIDIGLVGYSDDMEGLKLVMKNIMDAVEYGVNFGETSRKVTKVDWERAKDIIDPIIKKSIKGLSNAQKAEFVNFDDSEEEKEEVSEWEDTGVPSSDVDAEFESIEDDQEDEDVFVLEADEDEQDDIEKAWGESNSSDLEWGSLYIIDNEDIGYSYEILNKIYSEDTDVLIISRTHPKKLKEAYKIPDNATVLWLSKTHSDSSVTPTNIGKIASKINEFTEGNNKTIVMLDGLEYIVSNNDFNRVYRWLEDVSEKIVLSDSIMMVPIIKSNFEEKEVSLLKRGHNVLE